MKGRKITTGEIKIIGGPSIKMLKEFSYQLEPNQHAMAAIVGILEEEKEIKEWRKLLGTQTIVTVSVQTEEGERPIFSGYLHQINLQENTGIPLVTMHLISGSILLDREKIERSYQNITNSYATIVKEAIKETNDASCICSIGESVFPEKPFIQYRESSWEFAHRLASQLQGSLYPDITSPLPKFYFGFPKEKEKKALEIEAYQAGVSERFYELGGIEAGYFPQEFVFYQVKTAEDISLDTGVLWKGKHWRIGKKSAQLEREELLFTYILCQPKLVSLKPYHNSLFAGMSLLGTVLASEGETLKLHLDIDKTQEIGTAYLYEWTPDTGSVMYCMPKVGSKVSLYFSSEEEVSARVVNCIRENSETNAGMFEPTDRGLSTEHGKKLFLTPKELGVSEEAKGNYLKLEDEVGVRLESSKKIEITAKGKTKLIGKQVLLETPVEINLVSMNQISSSKSTKKAKANTTSFGSLSSSSPLQSSNATQVGFHPLSNSTQNSGISIDEDNLPETLLFMKWTSDPRHPEKEYYVTTVPKEYAVTRSLISFIPFMDKASDALLEWLTNAEIITAKEMSNAIKNFIGNVNNVYSIIDTTGGIKKLKDWEKIPKVAKKGLKWASKVSSIITYVFVGVDTVTELINDYTTGYIVDFIFGREMLADDKETALVKYIYAYQETKKLIQEGKIEYEKGILGPRSIGYKQKEIDEIVENIELIDELF